MALWNGKDSQVEFDVWSIFPIKFKIEMKHSSLQAAKTCCFKTNLYPDSAAFEIIMYNKVQIFWEGHKKFEKISHFIWRYLVCSNELKDCLKFLWPSQNICTLQYCYLQYFKDGLARLCILICFKFNFVVLVISLSQFLYLCYVYI